MALHYITSGRCNLSSLLLTFFLCLGAYSIIALAAPLEVTDIKTGNVTENSFTVSWMPPTGGNITDYRVIIIQGERILINETTINTTYTAIGLLPGINYTITIKAIDEGGNISNGSIRYETTLPSSVSDFRVTEVWTTQMNLSWTIPSDFNAQFYKYNISIQPKNETKVSSVDNFLATDLFPGSNYSFTIYTETEGGVQSSKSQEATNTTLPSPVQNLVVTSESSSSVTLQWTLSSDPNKESYTYTVDGGGTIEKKGIKENTTEIKNLTAGTNYNFTVYAVTENGISSKASDVANATTLPSPVQGLEVTSVSDNSVTLKWTFSTDPNNKSYSYTVDDGGSNKLTGIKENTAEMKNLTAGTDYNFTVFAVTPNEKYSKSSDDVNATTLPSPVKNLEVTSVSNSSVTLQWTFSSDPNNKSYSYTVVGGDSNKIAITENTTVVTDLTAGTDYNFTVIAVTRNGICSKSSDVANATTQPNIVQGVAASSVSNTTVTLQWNLSQDIYKDTYTYTVNGKGTGFSKILNITGDFVVVRGLFPGVDYTFTVYAVTNNGICSPSSKEVYATTKPSIVQGVAVSNLLETTMTLHWDVSNDRNEDTYTYTVDGQGKNFTNISNLTTNSVVIQRLLPGVEYTLTVYAITKNHVSSQPSKPVSATTMPSAPRNLEGNAVDVSEILINWTMPGDVNVKSYHYRVTWEAIELSQYNAYDTSDTHFIIKNLLPGYLYKITVQSVIRNSSSVNAETYTVTKPIPANNLRVTKINSTSVTIAWDIHDNPNSFRTGFRITGYSNGTEKLQNETKQKVFTAYSLDPGSMYKFIVESYASYSKPGPSNRMVTVKNNSSYSTQSIIEVETDPDSVENIKCSKVDAYQIKVYFPCPIGNYSTFKVLVNDVPRDVDYSCLKDALISNLQPAVSYRISVQTIAITKSVISEIKICETDSTGVIVGSIFGVLLFLLLIALIAFFVLRKRRSKGGSENIPNTTLKTRRFHTIPRDKFRQHYENNHADSDFGFAEEYQELNLVGTTQSKRAAELPENRAKNRFTNVLPYDHSRVKLSTMNGISTSDFVNANYMPGYNSTKEFIASQGPLPNTTADFWRMVWEHQVNTILMLTNCMENGRVKCEHYWPLDYTPCTYADITVTVTSETILSEWTIRDFSVKHANQPGIKYVRHFHFTAWPDHGVPDSTSSIVQFRNLVREHMDQRKSNGPTIVHCSAGVGRTGTLIALDYLIQQLEKEQRIGIYGFVEKMRMNRNLMVQTEAQYIFLNKCMLDLIDQPADENIYENSTGPELVYENISAIRNLQRENA